MGLLQAMVKTYRAERLSRGELEQLQQRRLNALVRFAKENSPYYRELFAKVGEEFRLEDLPATSKPEMMANFDRVLTDSEGPGPYRADDRRKVPGFQDFRFNRQPCGCFVRQTKHRRFFGCRGTPHLCKA